MQLHLTLEALNTRGGPLDQILEAAFDMAIIIDKNERVIFNTIGSANVIGRSQKDVVGLHILDVAPGSTCQNVIRTKKSQMNSVEVINGRQCITNSFPVICDGECIGAVGVVLFRGVANLKRIISSLNKRDGVDSEEVYAALARMDASYTFADFIGSSEATRQLVAYCRNVARRRVHPILIIGETGTGKEILASAFHTESTGGAHAPFVKINCTAIPNELLESELFGYEKGAFTGATASKAGKFELASGGTILLDEIGDMDIRLQSKLLRALEDGEYERLGGTRIFPLKARIIASTNHQLNGDLDTRLFRPDLYYRLSTVEIQVPPLRERREDIPEITHHLIRRANFDLMFSPSAMDALMDYHWPGNVRELRNILNRLSLLELDGEISAEHVHQFIRPKPQRSARTLPDVGSSPEGVQPSLDELERFGIMAALKDCRYNLTAAAQQLGITRPTLYNKIKRHKIEVPSTRVKSRP